MRRRLMREHDLQPRRRRRHLATTDSDHVQPIYPNRTRDLTIDGPNQLWVADITYVAIVAGLLRFMQQAKVTVLEVTTPDKQNPPYVKTRCLKGADGGQATIPLPRRGRRRRALTTAGAVFAGTR